MLSYSVFLAAKYPVHKTTTAGCACTSTVFKNTWQTIELGGSTAISIIGCLYIIYKIVVNKIRLIQQW